MKKEEILELTHNEKVNPVMCRKILNAITEWYVSAHPEIRPDQMPTIKIDDEGGANWSIDDKLNITYIKFLGCFAIYSNRAMARSAKQMGIQLPVGLVDLPAILYNLPIDNFGRTADEILRAIQYTTLIDVQETFDEINRSSKTHKDDLVNRALDSDDNVALSVYNMALDEVKISWTEAPADSTKCYVAAEYKPAMGGTISAYTGMVVKTSKWIKRYRTGDKLADISLAMTCAMMVEEQEGLELDFTALDYLVLNSEDVDFKAIEIDGAMSTYVDGETENWIVAKPHMVNNQEIISYVTNILDGLSDDVYNPLPEEYKELTSSTI